MTHIRALFLALLGINILAVALVVFHQVYGPRGNTLEGTQTSENSYRFTDPVVALQLLKRLDTSSALGDKALLKTSYKSAGSFVAGKDYCDKHREYFVLHPEIVFDDNITFITNYRKDHQLRTEVIPAIGEDRHPEWFPNSKRLKKFNVDLDTNIFFNHNLFYFTRQVGKQFSCLSQSSNHIPGHNGLYRKDYVAGELFKYAQGYKSRPTCFSYDQYFPKTFVLSEKDQCEEFFEEFNGPKYQKLKKERNVVYFRKIGAYVHEGSGVFPVMAAEEEKIRKLYGNGTKCGKITDNNLIQYNVHNPLLFENRKFGFRMFMLMASVNPVIAYYHDGYARLSIDEYDAKSNATRTFVTNIGVNLKEALKDTAFARMNASEIQEYTYWELDKVGSYLYENGIVKDRDWVNNHLRPQFKRVMIHLVRMGQSRFHKISSVFEIFGLDYVMDADLGLWFIEANAMPLIRGFTKGSNVLFRTMLKDTFEIVMGLTRSRVKRVIEYVNNLTDEINNNGIELSKMNLDARKAEFQKVIQNRFEPEFVPKPTNTYQQIIDENQVGTKRYFGLLKKKCL